MTLGFLAAGFALAGALAALGPLVLHLLHRRRYRVVEWGADALLQEAMRERRQPLMLRRVALLLLRCGALMLFGLALARPFWSTGGATTSESQPVHAILLVDNSLSMSYQTLGGDLLDQAKEKGRQFIERLPQGSQYSVLPLCGRGSTAPGDPTPRKTDALRALAAIQTVDASVSLRRALDLARQAAQLAPHLPVKRVALLGDQQATNWPSDDRWPANGLNDVQLIDVAVAGAENTWIADFHQQDSLTTTGETSTLVVRVRHEGLRPRKNAQLTLRVGQDVVASQSLDLQPGENRQVLIEHRWTQQPTGQQPLFVTASVTLSPDRLPADDARSLVLPVLTDWPILFVDELGDIEAPAEGRIGATYPLRRFLGATAPEDANGVPHQRHIRADQLTEEAREGIWLVVVAGVKEPGPAAETLRNYVVNGGRLLIAAGGAFDPDRWTAQAWQDGKGILPAPLESVRVGQSPRAISGEFAPLQIDAGQLRHPWFRLEGLSSDEQADLFRAPLFFQAVAANLSATRDLASDAQPRTIATFSNGVPCLVERDLGHGVVVLFASGWDRDWSTLAQSQAVLLLDRIARDLVESSLPMTNLSPAPRHDLALAPLQRQDGFQLVRPDGTREPAPVEALGDHAFGLALRDLWRRGFYLVEGQAASERPSGRSWRIPLAVNGPSAESDLRPLTVTQRRRFTRSAETGAVVFGDAIGLGGAASHGQWIWKWCLAGTLALLLTEMTLLAWPSLRGVAAT